MIEQRTGAEDRRKNHSQSTEVELTSFTQNIAAFEAIICKMEFEVSSSAPNLDRLQIYQSEVQSMLGEIKAQQVRAIDANGITDKNVQWLQQLLSERLVKVVEKTDAILKSSQNKLVVLHNQMGAIDPAAAELAMLLAPSSESASENGQPAANGRAEEVAGVAKLLNEVINTHPDYKSQLEPLLDSLLTISLRMLVERRADLDGGPPRPPVDSTSPRGDDDGMESRIANLEKFAEEARKDLRSVDVRLGKIETITDGIAKNMASRADVAELKGTIAKELGDLKGSVGQIESTLLKWFIGTALTLTSLAFAAAKLVH